MSNAPLKLFYAEPELDRWFRFDRHPRRVIRRLVRGAPQIGGVQRWFVNLCLGLDQLGAAYDVNDYNFFRKRRDTVAFVIGKSQVIDNFPVGVPIVFGPGIDSHPSANDFWVTTSIIHLLISCDWFAGMYERDLPRTIPITIWPAGIEVDLWKPPAHPVRGRKIIVYDKVRWERELFEPALIDPIILAVRAAGYVPCVLRYGHYHEEQFRMLLQEATAMIFLCEHETQGFAYLQALSANVPIFAWDRRGPWKDPSYYPRVVFEPVTSVPYFDIRCGRTFDGIEAFRTALPGFLSDVSNGAFRPREFVTDVLDLKDSASRFIEIAARISAAVAAGA
ncbi:MAG: glycosyltransferase family 1 protein [Gemmatimonadaceae bacterium]